jgi:transcriptional regulator
MPTMTLRRKAADRSALLQGTLDMLILRTLIFGPAHGHQIAKHIQQATDDILRLEHGSLYPALHRLERQGWVAAKWEVLGHQKRECKYYRLTPAGRRQLTAEESNWNRVAKAIARVMTTAPEKA